MFNAPEAKSVTEPRLDLIKQAGRQFAENGEITEDIAKEALDIMEVDKFGLDNVDRLMEVIVNEF